MLSRMSEPNREELVSILKDLQQKVNTVVEKTNANNSAVEATNSVEIEEPAAEEAPAVEEAPAAEEAAEPAAEVAMGGGRRKKQRRTKKQCGGRKSRKGRKGKGRSRRR